MSKRKGFLSLVALLLLSSVLTILSAALGFYTVTASRKHRASESLKSVYAAEAGANWGISYARRTEGPISTSFSVGERRVSVTISDSAGSGTILSTGKDEKGEYKRIVKLTYERTEAGIRVTNIQTEAG